MTKKMGRPTKKIEWGKVDSMASFFCTAVEIAEVLGISDDTLLRACKKKHGLTFAEYIKTKQGLGRASLRRRMWTSAQEGSIPMMIFLSKNVLGMSDYVKSDSTISYSKKTDALLLLKDKIKKSNS